MQIKSELDIALALKPKRFNIPLVAGPKIPVLHTWDILASWQWEEVETHHPSSCLVYDVVPCPMLWAAILFKNVDDIRDADATTETSWGETTGAVANLSKPSASRHSV